MQNTELTQPQRDALWQCYSFLLQRRAARLAREQQAADERYEEQTSETPDNAEQAEVAECVTSL